MINEEMIACSWEGSIDDSEGPEVRKLEGAERDGSRDGEVIRRRDASGE